MEKSHQEEFCDFLLTTKALGHEVRNLGTSVISHKGLIGQGAEHPEYQVEDLLLAGLDNIDGTTMDSPDDAQPLPGQGCTYDGNGVTSVLALDGFWICDRFSSCQDDPVEDPPGFGEETFFYDI
ncbi:hypothetical protein llap_18337 [Limosa lapponica baueri]|uniref:Uncharacterized protein n=1 Tax=Limosa lapponica baueri TaxID=1758121 RepID=A0A2I0TC40_LIMLA|nr:hypothetical protein llap_18337 [Limosa lapponica baueri]